VALDSLGNSSNYQGRGNRMQYWEIIADKLKATGWSYGYVSAVDSNGRTIWIVDAHRDSGQRFALHAIKAGFVKVTIMLL
jgi:hypothetical protein